MEAADLSAAFNECENRLLWRGRFICAILGFAAREGFVGFDEFPFAAERTKFAFAHRLADAVHHEPSGFVAATHHAVHLKRGHALFAAVQQIDRHAPFAERDFGALANRVDRNGELLAAVIALKQAGSMRLAVQPRYDGRAAMRTERTIGPNPCLEPLASRVFVMKDRVVEMAGHEIAPFE
jgi:hypothetical protein